MRWEFALDDARTWQAIALLVIVVVSIVVRYLKTKKNEFVIDNELNKTTLELDVGLDYKRLPNHFRTFEHSDNHADKSLYEYRVDGTNVLSRLITKKTSYIHDPVYRYEVRDGVVLGTDMRKRAESQGGYWLVHTEDQVASLKREVEWQKMTPLAWRGLKYFIVSKKLPSADARRYLRQELERLKSGCDAVFKEAGKLGLEPDDDSKFVDRLKVADGKPTPSNEEIQKLFESIEMFGITDLEFSWEKKLCAVLEKLLPS